MSFASTGLSKSGATATASASGAPDTEPAGKKVKDNSDDQRTFANDRATANGAKGSSVPATPEPSNSDDEGVSVAAAVAINIVNSRAKALIPELLNIVAGGLLSLHATGETDASAVADGSATGGGTANVGAGVAINLAYVVVDASIDVETFISALGLSLKAGMGGPAGSGADSTNSFMATATAGAGGGNVGIAGAFAGNFVNVDSTAMLREAPSRGPPLVDAHNHDVTLSATSTSTSTAKALPGKGGTSGSEKVGIGASLALNLVDDTTLAVVSAGAAIVSADDVVLVATTTHAMTTEAETGAKGNVAVAPAVGVAISNITTRASIGTAAAPLTVAGKVDAKAVQTASALTSAKGGGEGDKAAVGIAFAGTFADHLTESFSERAIAAGGAVSFQALGSSNTNAVSKASATGAPEEKTPKGPDVTEQANKELKAGDKASKAKGGKGTGSKTTPATENSGGTSVSVAAAVSVNLVDTVSRAHVPDGLTIVAGGTLTLRSSANTDAVAKADGAASNTSSTAVGVGVAVNLVDMLNEALVGLGPDEGGGDPAGPAINAEGLVLEALMTDVSGDGVHTMGAEATSGASGGKIGIAGGFAGNFTDLVTSALITAGSVVDADADNTPEATDDVTLKAASKAVSTVKALPHKITGAGVPTSIGIGASLALNLVDDTTLAVIAAGASLTAADDLTLDAASAHAMVTDAETGAAGKVAVAPSVAVAVSNITSRAAIETGPDLLVAGKVDAKAAQTASALTSATGDTAGEQAAVGISFAGTFADHISESFTDRALTAGGAVSFQALGSSNTNAIAKASASGAPSKDDPATAPAGDVKEQSEKELKAGDKASKAKGGKGTGSKTTPASENSSGTSVSVAAAVGVNLVTTVSRAYLPDAPLVVIAGGVLTLRSSANTDAVATADGAAKNLAKTGANSIAIGVGVAVNLVDMFNEALIGRGPDENDIDLAGPNVTAEGLVLEALMTDVSGNTVHTMGAEAGSGASGGSVGIAGGFAGNFTDLVTSALITRGSVVDADADNTHEATDDVSLKAASKAASTVKALPDKLGGASGADTVGIGASIALNLVDDTTLAVISPMRRSSAPTT